VIARIPKGAGVHVKQGLELFTQADHDLRRFRECAWPSDPLDSPRVRRWQEAKRIALAALLALSALHYYFVDVQLTIMTLPGAGAVPSYGLNQGQCVTREEGC
jgi:hypothetical protein